MTELTSVERWKLLVVRAKLKGTYQSKIENVPSFRRYLDRCCQGFEPWLEGDMSVPEEQSYVSYRNYLGLNEDD